MRCQNIKNNAGLLRAESDSKIRPGLTYITGRRKEWIN